MADKRVQISAKCGWCNKGLTITEKTYEDAVKWFHAEGWVLGEPGKPDFCCKDHKKKWQVSGVGRKRKKPIAPCMLHIMVLRRRDMQPERRDVELADVDAYDFPRRIYDKIGNSPKTILTIFVDGDDVKILSNTLRMNVNRSGQMPHIEGELLDERGIPPWKW